MICRTGTTRISLNRQKRTLQVGKKTNTIFELRNPKLPFKHHFQKIQFCIPVLFTYSRCYKYGSCRWTRYFYLYGKNWLWLNRIHTVDILIWSDRDALIQADGTVLPSIFDAVRTPATLCFCVIRVGCFAITTQGSVIKTLTSRWLW